MEAAAPLMDPAHAIDGHTRLLFVLGYPVSHSLSPAMQQAAIRAAGLNAAYLPWAVPPDGLPAAVQGLRTMANLLGANVTVPHKEAILPLLDGLAPEAEAMGAVNTILVREGKLVGDNTDGPGFLAALGEGLGCQAAGLAAVVLGAGGAARAVTVSLARAGARRLVLMNRSPERALRLADRLRAQYPACSVEVQRLESAWRVPQPPEMRLLVNTTSQGLAPADPPLFAYDSLGPPLAVMDLIYNPPETPLLRAAWARGCRATNGLRMLLHQGALSFERWTGLPAPVAAMQEVLPI